MNSKQITVQDPSTLDIRPGDLVYTRRPHSTLGRRIYVTTVERYDSSLWIHGHLVGSKSNIAKLEKAARLIMSGYHVKVLRRDSEATPGTKPGRELAASDVVRLGARKATVTAIRQSRVLPLNIGVTVTFDDGRGRYIIVQPDQRITLWKEPQP